MKRLIIMAMVLLMLAACGGGSGVNVQSISVPVVQEIAYKDIISCTKVDEEFSDCKVRHPKSGLAVVLRIKTRSIPKSGTE